MNLSFKNILSISLIFSSTFFCAYGQGSRLKFANRQFDSKAFYFAAEAYEDVLERGVDSLIIAKNIAESYKNIDNLTKADKWFDFLNANNKLTQEEMISAILIKRSLGDYKNAALLMKQYETNFGSNELINSLNEESQMLQTLLKDTGRFKLNTSEGNTKSSEIGVTYTDSANVILASSKKSSFSLDRIQAWTGGHYYNLYTSKKDADGNLLKLKQIKGDVNTKFNDGPACFDSVNNRIYFTRNNFLKGSKGRDSEGRMLLKLYSGDLYKNKLKNVQELSINSNEYSCGHPSISADGKTLYFVSDRPGGFGGTDLYKVSINENGLLGEPINLGGKINTSSDEFSPFIHPQENVLFFSSNGHFGIGGHDVFVAKLSANGDVHKIENVGSPINSSRDDLFFVNNLNQTEGFVASNRQGGVGSDDIYFFNQLSPYRSSSLIKGSVFDLLTKEKLDGVEVELQDSKGNSIGKITNEDDGTYELYLESIEEDFKIIASKNGYIVAEEEILFEKDRDTYGKDLKLMPVIDYYVAGIVLDKTTNLTIEGVTVSIQDLKSQAKLPSLSTLADGKFNTEPVGYYYGDTVQFEIIFQKKGYITKTYVVRDLLSTSPEVFVSGQIEVMLTPIETGIDVGVASDLNTIYFDLNSSILRAESKVELNKIVEFLNENLTVSIELGAHTDCRADDNYNMWLSERRAKNSADYLKARIKNPSRVSYKGYGETKPIHGCNCEDATAGCSEEEHQMNRRTEFIVTGIKK